MAGIFDFFKSGTSNPGSAPVQQQQQPQQPRQQTPGNMPPTQTTPGSGVTPQTSGNQDPNISPSPGEKSQSPLANYDKLWQADATKVTPNLPKPEFKFDPAKINEAARAVDFSAAIPQEIKDKILAGDSAAFTAAMNHIGQSAYAQSIGASAKLTEAALDKFRVDLTNDYLPKYMKQQNSRSTAAEISPLFTDPAAAPLMETLRTQIVAAYPNASGQEVAAHAKDFLSSFAELVVKHNGGTISTNSTDMQSAINRGENTDWEKYFAS